MTVRIRAAGTDDVETLFDIRTSVRENHESREELAKLGITPASVAEALAGSSRAWLAEVDGEPAAFAMANNDEGCVFGMFVRPQFEARGLGRLLMAEAERFLFQDHPTIWLTTGADHAIRANGFYRRLGWHAVCRAGTGELRYEKSRTEAA